MGKVIVSVCLSVDGYAEGPGGDLSVMPMSEVFNEHNAELIRGARTLLYGATTYRQMVAHWPKVLDDPDASQAERSIAQRMAEGTPVVAVSDSLVDDDTGPWTQQTTIVRRDQAHQAVASLREQDGDTVVFGSQTVWTDLFARDLVDELHIMIGPALVAGDRPAFSGAPPTDLRLLGVRHHDDVGTVVLHYAVHRGGHAGPR